MASFSKSQGLVSEKKAVQKETIDKDLRTGLWNVLDTVVWSRFSDTHFVGGPSNDTRQLIATCCRLWGKHFIRPFDTMPKFKRPESGGGAFGPGLDEYSGTAYGEFRKHFFSCEWNEVYDFIEDVIEFVPVGWAKQLAPEMNYVLERENSAYRISGGIVIGITDEIELAAIEDALETPFGAAKEHLTRSVELLWDRTSPDYRNAVKEAISAVESACKEFTGKPRATLNDCITEMEKAGELHGALKAGWANLYGYTSDSGGIRHALMEGDRKPAFSEAKYMLVSCCAFVNLVAAKKAEAG